MKARFLFPILVIFFKILQNMVHGETQVGVGTSDDQIPQDLVVAYALPVQDGPLSDLNTVVDLSAFETCIQTQCSATCGRGTKNITDGYCDSLNPKLCMCSKENFFTVDIKGTVVSVDRTNSVHKNCSVGCNKRDSYARIWTKPDKTLNCICLMHQTTSTGITRCDKFAVFDICIAICQTDSAVCTFNGVCLCKKNWEPFFNLSVANVRKEEPQDLNECSTLCSGYHHDYVQRIYDTKLSSVEGNKTYKFREKFCLCGDWIDLMKHPKTSAIVAQGFQLCSGLKCKRRCGMDEAVCEPKFRRGCICKRENILIGDHLWSRLPTHNESKCYETCHPHGLDARVIEWNPFMKLTERVYDPRYRKSAYQYSYDGKFCHCIHAKRNMRLYRPCTDELCQTLCGHYEAECDKRTRRACFCNTHQLARGIGRRPDPGEVNCNIACRYGLYDARVLDVRFKVPVDIWSVESSSYCGCIRSTTLAGLSHCDAFNDQCPTYCGIPEAYCTREKYCHCGIVPNLLQTNPMIRLGNGKEQEECSESCRSWLWPLAEDRDNFPFIYDESLEYCSEAGTCPAVDTTPWKWTNTTVLDALDKKSDEIYRRFCLCAKTVNYMFKPGRRLIMEMEPVRIPKTTVPCLMDHHCKIVGNALHVVA